MYFRGSVLSTPGHCVRIANRLCEYPSLFSRDLSLGSVYQYWVITISGSEESEPSPAAIYIHGSGYCGDGIIQK